MVYQVECSICEFEDEISDLDSVLDAQEEHRESRGEQHLLEFEKL